MKHKLHSDSHSLLLFSILLLTTIIIIILRPTFGLQQVAGPIVIQVEPGETAYFSWGLLTDMNQSNSVNLTAHGTGAEYVRIPEDVTLNPGNITYVQGNVTIPNIIPRGVEFKPVIQAIEVSNFSNIEGSMVNVQMSKVLSIMIGNNTGFSAAN